MRILAGRSGGRQSRARLRTLLARPEIAALRSVAHGRSLQIVGGAVRDALLGSRATDLDAIVAGDGEEIAEGLATTLPATLVRLGGERFAAYRLVGDACVVDLWDRGTASLDDELRRRDFTINAIAIDLGSGDLLDPTGGLTDLRARILRATALDRFEDDPLRVLRLARFAATLERSRVDPATLAAARAAAPLLARVAPERVREEFLALYRSAGAARGQRILEATGVYPELWSENKGSGKRASSLFERFSTLSRQRAASRARGRARGPQIDSDSVARLALTFVALGRRGLADRIASFRRRGLLSKHEAFAVERIAALVLERPPASEAARRWWLHRAGDHCLSAALAAHASARGARTRRAWSVLFLYLKPFSPARLSKILAPPRFLDGDEIALATGLAGPALGKAIALLERAVVEGRIANRASALDFVRDGGKKRNPSADGRIRRVFPGARAGAR